MSESLGRAANPKRVVVVHGRNMAARSAMFQFLRALHLEPVEWSEAVNTSGVGAPYIGNVLDTLFAEAQAVVVLLTGDDEARLRDAFMKPDDDPREGQLTPQARPNVLFEAGMAFAKMPSRTILVQLEPIRPFSDVAGRHVLRFSTDAAFRKQLAEQLRTVGCEVVTSGDDWLHDGDFEGARNLAPATGSRGPAGIAQTRQRMYYFDLCWELEAQFFHDDYRSILNPSANTLDDLITGPFCPRCGRPLRREARVVRFGPPVYGIENPCSGCGRSITALAGISLENYQKQLWTEAQRLVRLRKPFPPCPAPDMP